MSQSRASGISRKAPARPRRTRSRPPALITYSTIASRRMPGLVRQTRVLANRPFAAACYRRRMSWRYDVVGFLGGDFGLAVADRNSVRVLDATGRLEKK